MTSKADLARLLASQSGGLLTIEDVGTGWPARGKLVAGRRSIPVALYLGVIGESHRNREEERRFQNPGQGRPIRDVEGGIPLLLGLWSPDDGGEAVVVAFDAYRRLDLMTRFSLFMPTALLEDARAEGASEYESTVGEVVQAFSISRLRDYLGTLFDPTAPGAASATAPLTLPDSESSATIHIRPKVGMYAAFARLNYKPWYALAEFVDNAIQSYLSHREHLGKAPLEVEVRIDDDAIVVADRAAGIAWADFPRAFSPSQPPPDPSGLSEFGLGMKAAACWFANSWSVRTSALGEPVEREIRFDVDQITRSGQEHLAVESRPASVDSHYTIITMSNPRVRPRTKTLGKIKAHLSSIYRVLLQKGIVKLTVESAAKREELSYGDRRILVAPYFREPNGQSREWKKSFSFDLGAGRLVSGWAGLLEKGSASRAGLSVFRRDRLIQGSDDDTYRPLSIFRSPNSYTYQRLVGELHVDGFNVSHTKDGIQWDGYEEEILQLLKAELNDESFPMLKQAEGFRSRARAKDLPSAFGAEALQGAGAELEGSPLSGILEEDPGSTAAPAESDPAVEQLGDFQPARELEQYETTVTLFDERWRVRLKLISDGARDWYGLEDASTPEGTRLDVWINLGHPFSESYVNGDENTLGPLVRLVSALALAEHAAFRGGVQKANVLRHKVNRLLRESFSGDGEGQGSR